MHDYKKIELLVKVAKLYYEQNFSQDLVAKTLNLSRPYISKLLNEAKESGIVKVEVHDPTKIESNLERKFKNKFNLKKVIIVPKGTDENPIAKLGKEAARYLDSILKSGDIIGLSWGETIYHCSRAAFKRNDLDNIVTVQLCGGISNLKSNIYATEIAKNFSSALSGTPYILPLPAVVDDSTLKKFMLQDHNIDRIIDYGMKSNIAMFTMGSFGNQSALVSAGYLSKEQMLQLSEKGAVGDICSHVIDFNGNLCDRQLDDRTIAVPLANIREKEYRIGVAMGQSKVNCICGALNGGCINVLITNEETAGWVLNRFGDDSLDDE